MSDFNNCGLKHTIAHLEAMWEIIPLLPVEKQAEYADEVCVKNVNNHAFLMKQIPLDENMIAQAVNNTTGIGNVAYIALHAPIPQVREVCKKALDILKRKALE